MGKTPLGIINGKRGGDRNDYRLRDEGSPSQAAAVWGSLEPPRRRRGSRSDAIAGPGTWPKAERQPRGQRGAGRARTSQHSPGILFLPGPPGTPAALCGAPLCRTGPPPPLPRAAERAERLPRREAVGADRPAGSAEEGRSGEEGARGSVDGRLGRLERSPGGGSAGTSSRRAEPGGAPRFPP